MIDVNSPHTSIKIYRQEGSLRTHQEDTLAVEEPLEIRLGYTDKQRGRIHKSISITMRTPGHDLSLAIGFLYSESIINNIEQISSIDQSKKNIIRIELLEQVSFDLSRLERHFYTTSSCGICGKASLEQLSLNGAEAIHNNTFSISQEKLLTLNDSLRKRQVLFNKTGGNHATAIFNSKGEILSISEDVGRHNAMDKLIGDMLKEHTLPIQEQGIMVSGRASFELMQKALIAGCPMLIAVGAPSSLAVELAQEYNITLIGFLNNNGFNIYHGEKNIK